MTLTQDQLHKINLLIDYREKGKAGHQNVLDARTGKTLTDIFSESPIGIDRTEFEEAPITALLKAIYRLQTIIE